MTDTETRITALLTRIVPGIPLAGVDFVKDGYLDSLDVIRLATELEGEFGIQIEGSRIVPENFKDVAALTALVGGVGTGNA